MDKIQPLADSSLNTKILDVLKVLNDSNNVKIGANEVTKILNKGKALLVILACDCEPIEIIKHIPVICENKDVPFVYVKDKTLLGKACDIKRPVIACAIYAEEEQYDRTLKAVTGLIEKIN